MSEVKTYIPKPTMVNALGKPGHKLSIEQLSSFVSENTGKKGFIWVGAEKTRLFVESFHPLHLHQVKIGWITHACTYEEWLEATKANDNSEYKKWKRKNKLK